jgi:hypothetical protein
MAAARFCSECGERLKVKRSDILPFRSFCPRCSPRFRRIRLMLIAIPFLCAAIGFASGHYTRTRESFYFIGTPVDLSANRVAPSADNNNDHSSRGSETLTQPEQLVISPSAAEAICGARTKSGKPCRRKVKGGGYCWQHRRKPGTEQVAPNTQ